MVFMENVYEILNEDLEEVRKEFNKVRDVVQVVFGVVKELQDKVLVIKIMIVFVIYEFVEKFEVVVFLCMKYLF